MKIAIIGAGFAGLSAARVLQEMGHEVTVHEKAPDVGGVWSASRRYPGVRTQNNKGTYALSELPMPRSYPEWPSGEQVQAYLETYAETFDLTPLLRLDEEVTRATPTRDGWVIESGGAERSYDHLVVANGIFSEPVIPPFAGVEDLEAVGGKVLAASDFHDLEEARGKKVLVVGYGKSALDVAVEIAHVAAGTHVVARELLWKMPKKLGNVLNYKYLMLTRMGEGLFRYQELKGVEKFLHGAGNGVRRRMLGSVESIGVRQLHLKQLGLVPDGSFEDIARSTVSLSTDGFYDAVQKGDIEVHRDTTVARFLEKDGAPWAELSDGSLVPADLVVCGTGFRQHLPFFDPELEDRLTDDAGDFQLYRQILPHDVPNLTFAGYNSSFFSPLSAEMSAVWIASHLDGLHDLPPVEERRRVVTERVAWMKERTNGQHARGTNVIPFSMHNVDEVLDDLRLNVGRGTRARQWLGPVSPKSYRKVLRKLKRRQALRESVESARSGRSRLRT